MRATPDLALDANPNSGVSVYDSVPCEDHSGWFTIGGTSASTVMVAAEAAVTGAEVNAKYIYASPANIPFRDVTAGSNGYPALPGYDLATGLGAWSYAPVPNGLNAMSVSGSVTLSWLEHRLRHGGPRWIQQETCNAPVPLLMPCRVHETLPRSVSPIPTARPVKGGSKGGPRDEASSSSSDFD